MSKIYFLLFFYISNIKSDTWLPEVNGHYQTDDEKGYAGKKGKAITDFYLYGSRNYRVHFLGDDKKVWSTNYIDGDAVGDGREIDGISISGGNYYQVRILNGNWLPLVSGNDIDDSEDGYAGILGKKIDGILIYGNQYYRVAYGKFSSNPEKVANRLFKNLFGINLYYTLLYTEEEEIMNTPQLRVTAQLIYSYDINIDGKIKFEIEDNKIKGYDLSGMIGIDEDINDILKEAINMDINKFIRIMKTGYSNSILHGTVYIDFFFLEQRIQIDAALKYTKDEETFRGGNRINIYIGNFIPHLEEVAETVRVFSKYEEKKKKAIIDNLVEILKEIKDLIEIMSKFKKENYKALLFAIIIILLAPIIAIA